MKKLRCQYGILKFACEPLGTLLSELVEKLQAFDKRKIFYYPVSVKEVPDYLDIIKNPMDFLTIKQKFDSFYFLLNAWLHFNFKSSNP